MKNNNPKIQTVIEQNKENIIIKRQNPNKQKKLKTKEIITTDDKKLLGALSIPLIIGLIGTIIIDPLKNTHQPLSFDLLTTNILLIVVTVILLTGGIGSALIMGYHIIAVAENIEREKRKFKEKQKTITHKLPIQTIQNKNNIKKIETLANDPDTKTTVNNAIDDLIKINKTELNPHTKNQTNKTIINYILSQEKTINERKQLENIKTQTETHILNKATKDIQQSNESIAESITQKYQWLNQQH